MPVVAGQHIVEGVLDSGQAGVLYADGPQYLCGEVPLRIGALGLEHGVDALDAELADPVAERSVHPVAQVDEALVPVAQLLQQLLLGAAEQRGESRGDPGRVVDQERMREHGHGVLGHGKLDSVAVEDHPAPGGDLEILDLLLERPLAQRVGLDGADPDGSQRGGAEQEQEEGEQEPDPALDQPHGYPCRAAPAPGGLIPPLPSPSECPAGSWWRWSAAWR